MITDEITTQTEANVITDEITTPTEANVITDEITTPDSDLLITESNTTEARPDSDRLTTEANVVTTEINGCNGIMCKNGGTLWMYGHSCFCTCESRWMGPDCSG